MFCAVGMLALVGCALDGGSQDGGDPLDDRAEEELNALSVTLDGSASAITVEDRPRLKPRARGSLACAGRFEADGRVRLTCTRGAEQLEVIVRGGEQKALLVHRSEGASSDRRYFYACTTSGDGPGELPSKLACQNVRPAGGGGHGGLSSPFRSTVEGIGIPNTHRVGSDAKLLRGMAPRSDEDFAQLVDAEVGAVLVFKNQTGSGSDVADEMAKLVSLGVPTSRVKNIPFRWKDLPDFTEPCTQTVEALAFLDANLAAGKKTFFHCTVGEDRTGLLSAVHRLIREPGLDAETAWDREMCERGYGAGNPLKPAYVKGELERGLKPLYRKLAYLVKKGSLGRGALDTSVCATDPEGAADFEAKAPAASRLVCGTSTSFEP